MRLCVSVSENSDIVHLRESQFETLACFDCVGARDNDLIREGLAALPVTGRDNCEISNQWEWALQFCENCHLD